MDDLQRIRGELEKLPLSAMAALADETGIPEDTLIKIKYRTTKNPRYETVKRLAARFPAKRKAA